MPAQVFIDATRGLDPAKVMDVVKAAVMPGVPDALKVQAEHDMNAAMKRHSVERECIRKIETNLGMIEDMILDTRAMIERYKRELERSAA